MITAATIVVVDDDDGVRRVTELQLTLSGYSVVTCRDAREAIPVIRSAFPDLIVTDLQMPGMNGLELISALRSDAATCAIPVILFTASSETDSGINPTFAPAWVLHKPASIRKLTNAVRSLLEGRSVRRPTAHYQLVGAEAIY